MQFEWDFVRNTFPCYSAADDRPVRDRIVANHKPTPWEELTAPCVTHLRWEFQYVVPIGKMIGFSYPRGFACYLPGWLTLVFVAERRSPKVEAVVRGI